jgi:GT2 family glycosyltransferase
MQNLSIIIVNYKGWNSLKACLDSLESYHSKSVFFEVIIVDNFSDDGNLKSFQQTYSNFIFIENSGNNGFANGCNVGAKIAKHDLFLFLNPDTIILENSLDIFVNDYISNPEITLLSCLQIDENNSYYNQKRLFPTFFTFFGLPRAIFQWIHKTRITEIFGEDQHFFYPEWVTGAVILIHKKWFEAIDGWDESYWMYMEDVDFCKKITSLNGRVAVTKNCTIFHKHGGASRINIKTKALTKTEVIISKHVYIDKHFSKIIGFFLHIRLFGGVFLEKMILSILSVLLFFNLKLKVNRIILSNYFRYALHVIRHNTFLSQRSLQFKKNVRE